MATAFKLIPQEPTAGPAWYDADLKRLYRALEAKYRRLPDSHDDAHVIYGMMATVEELDTDLQSVGGAA